MAGTETAIDALLTAAQRVLGMSLCVHAFGQSVVSPKWLNHKGDPCLSVKRKHRLACQAHCAGTVHDALDGAREGGTFICSFGYTQLIVPLQHEDQQFGILFAGPVWVGRKAPPHPKLPVVHGKAWLRERLLVLETIGDRLATMLASTVVDTPERTGTIRTFLRTHARQPVQLADLAGHLGLSPSRARHLVRELFNCSYSELLQRTRLNEAARLLVVTDASIGAVAARVGYEDQNYFTRHFRRHFGMPPRAYRKRFEPPESARASGRGPSSA
jgi:AraC-like DNA-binding protein